MPKPATRDDTIDLLNEILKRRLRETFDKFCAEIPELLDEVQRTAETSPEGREFVRTLLAWISGVSRRSEQASRYLLMWYAKTLAAKSAHETPDCRDVAELLRRHLRRDELAAVDEALAAGWKALPKAHSLSELASRRRREFLASLTPDQSKRFAPYLSAFMPAIPWPTSAPIDPRPDVGSSAAPSASIHAGSWMASHVTSAAIVAGILLLAALGWYVVRGRTAMDREASASSKLPGAPPAAHKTRQEASAPAAPTPASSADAEDGAIPAGRVLPSGSPPSFTWTRQTSGTTSPLKGIAWSGKLAVVVGYDGTILSSEDGIAWKAAPQLAVYSYAAVAHRNGLFVAVGTSKRGTHYGRVVSSSADGATWTTQRWQERTGLNSIAYGNGSFVAAGNRGAIVRSTAGETWYTVTSDTSEHLDGVSFLNDRFVVIGHNGTTMISSDGAKWTLKQHSVRTLYFRAEFGNGIYLALGQRQDARGAHYAMAWLSPDLKAWTEQEVSGLTGFRHSIFVASRFVASGSSGGILTSPDGLAWTMEVPPSSYAGQGDLVWTGSMLIAVGLNGEIYTGTSVARSASSP